MCCISEQARTFGLDLTGKTVASLGPGDRDSAELKHWHKEVPEASRILGVEINAHRVARVAREFYGDLVLRAKVRLYHADAADMPLIASNSVALVFARIN